MNNHPHVELSLVVPVYREEAGIGEFLRQVLPILDGLGLRCEIIFALDPSPDRTEALILEHRQRDPRIKLLKFSRRVGQPMATLAGLQYAGGDAVLILDADLQDPPALIPEMVAQWKEGHDVVIPQRRNRRGETWLKRLTARLGYGVIQRISDPPIPPETGDFRLLSRRVVNEINRLKECHGFLRGLVAVVGFKQVLLPFDRPDRFAGPGHYNRFFGSLRIGFNGLICFSHHLLTLATKCGLLCSALALLLAGAYALSGFGLFPFPLENPGLFLLVLFLGGLQLTALGILGEYIGRIYDEVKQRPKFIVESCVGFETPPAPPHA